ncbi:hypothetical protein SKUN_00867 [Spiroplasma kunkelii CR2-3x]|uniref:Uncharacterized protein n=1 Tax=Spiroplasma kunkelii CR2-3x TaxID=273035 RepID=A0A0K2JH71_SPIKU|nr:hypothetical protein [Spiroplasma kunkelii]ALA97757.1 hypothetical protein SKUN_00867 [Spiroplasma kunkelii CR2-3x]
MNIKKILSLIGATAITTSGVAPLMAMMPNNKSSNFSTAESSSSVTRGEDKVLKNYSYKDDKKQKHFFADWIIYLSLGTIQNLYQILNNVELNDTQKSEQMIQFVVTKLIEINPNDDTNDFVSNLSKISPTVQQQIFYNDFFWSLPKIFSKTLIETSNNGIAIILNSNGEVIHLFPQ